MKVSLYTPEKTLLDKQEVREVLVPSVKGELGILPGHAPLVSLLKAGVLKYWSKASDQEEKIAIGWGYLEIHQGDIRVLAESAETKQTLDKAKSETDLKKVLKQLNRWDIEPSKRVSLEREKLRLEGELEL